jgi:hypothetical protein
MGTSTNKLKHVPREGGVQVKKPVAKIEKINYQGWPNSYRMTNGEVELVITGDIGPRIIRYAFVGGRNLFHEFPTSSAKAENPPGRIAVDIACGLPRKRRPHPRSLMRWTTFRSALSLRAAPS